MFNSGKGFRRCEFAGKKRLSVQYEDDKLKYQGRAHDLKVFVTAESGVASVEVLLNSSSSITIGGYNDDYVNYMCVGR